MKPGNKSLYLDNISSASFHLSPDTTVHGSERDSHVCDLQSAFQTAHNLRGGNMIVSVRTMGRRRAGGQRSSSGLVPDIRNGMKIFSPVSG